MGDDDPPRPNPHREAQLRAGKHLHVTPFVYTMRMGTLTERERALLQAQMELTRRHQQRPWGDAPARINCPDDAPYTERYIQAGGWHMPATRNDNYNYPLSAYVTNWVLDQHSTVLPGEAVMPGPSGEAEITHIDMTAQNDFNEVYDQTFDTYEIRPGWAGPRINSQHRYCSIM